MPSKIYGIYAREILDSRGDPTVETTVILESGYRGIAAVPSGASVGTQEALELRDGEPSRYNGRGVSRAVGHVNNYLGQKLVGLDALDQKTVDDRLLELDGTPNKSRVGANAILSISLAAAVAAANSQRQPLYRYLNDRLNTQVKCPLERIPVPVFNLLNGGLHAGDNVNFQEFQVIPASSFPFHEALETGVNIYQQLKKTLHSQSLTTTVGDEGGFAPVLQSNISALEIIVQALKDTKYRLGAEVFLGLDLAANHFKTPTGYQIKDRPSPFQAKELLDYLQELQKKYQLIYLEDLLEETDWPGWTLAVSQLGEASLVVGDDFLATNPALLERAITEKSVTAMIIKPNQIGTLTEALSVIALAKKNDIKLNVSHRSGETTDTFIADLAVAAQSEYVKFGAPCRGERVVKYNRLLAIEAELIPK